MTLGSASLLPQILERQSREFKKYSHHINPNDLSSVEAKLDRIESLLNRYEYYFPYFVKVDAWRAYCEDSNYDLWVLERIGWGRWNKENRLIFVMEGVSIPKLDNAEVISVNSASPPFLTGARELDWSEQILAEEVQAALVTELPNAVKEKIYPFLEEFLIQLSETISQMEKYDDEFSVYLEQKIDEYLERVGDGRKRRKSEAIHRYFTIDRRVELFYEFLEDYDISR